MTRKGFIFTADAIIAFILLLSIVTVFTISQETNDSGEVRIDALNQKTLDDVVVKNYKQPVIGIVSQGNVTETRICNITYYYDFSKADIADRIREQKSCEATA
jgi:hypothetical protein